MGARVFCRPGQQAQRGARKDAERGGGGWWQKKFYWATNLYFSLGDCGSGPVMTALMRRLVLNLPDVWRLRSCGCGCPGWRC
jgi:hypothetical protein